MPIQLANRHVEPSVSDDRSGLANVIVVISALNEEQSLLLVLADLPDVG